jgi:hypothetical protein
MNILGFVTEENDRYYDFNTLMNVLNMSKSKLYRDLKKVDVDKVIRYKNQYLYNEKTLLLLIENILIERLKKIDNRVDELRENNTD